MTKKQIASIASQMHAPPQTPAAAQTRHTPEPFVVKVVPTSCGRCFKVGPQSAVDHDYSGAACLYDDSTSLNPETPGTIEARANLIAASVNALAGLNPSAFAKVIEVLEEVAEYDTGEQDCIGADAKAALAALKGAQ